MNHAQTEAASEALIEVGIISSLIMRLANSSMNTGEAIQPEELTWLIEHLDVASESARSAVEGREPPT